MNNMLTVRRTAVVKVFYSHATMQIRGNESKPAQLGKNESYRKIIVIIMTESERRKVYEEIKRISNNNNKLFSKKHHHGP